MFNISLYLIDNRLINDFYSYLQISENIIITNILILILFTIGIYFSRGQKIFDTLHKVVTGTAAGYSIYNGMSGSGNNNNNKDDNKDDKKDDTTTNSSSKS